MYKLIMDPLNGTTTDADWARDKEFTGRVDVITESKEKA